jgi:DNA-binding SARP family transcriptional activator
VDVAPLLWPAATAAEQPAGAVDSPAPRFQTGIEGGDALQVRCFGRFTLTAGGETLDLAGLRPKSRSLLRWLCVQSGDPLHRETIMTTLWPQDQATAATRKLHVLVSSLRQLFGPVEARIGAPLLVREGHSYRLAGPPHVQIDITAFTRGLAAAEVQRTSGDGDAAAASLEAALDQYRGELVPEEGPAEWIVESRERLRLQAADAIVRLVALLSETNSPVEGIIDWCERGLKIDRYSDDLWKRLIDLHEQRADAAKAARLRLQYQLMLAELGV